MNQVIVIIDGGNPLKDCPSSWEEAELVEAKLNLGKKDTEPQWRFDCGFKLDFDGEGVSSRFYPPKTHYGNTWDGIVTISFAGQELNSKAFDCPSLEALQKEVEQYIVEVKATLAYNFGAKNES